MRGTVALWWTESEIGAVALNTLGGDGGRKRVREHVEGLLREKISTTLGIELRSATEEIGEAAKASLRRKLNALYTSECERLAAKLTQFEHDLVAAEPTHYLRLEALERKLNEVNLRYGNWLDEPSRALETMVAAHVAQFTADLATVSRDFSQRARVATKRVEARLELMIETRLHNIVLDAVRDHVRSAPIDRDGLSNKQLAKERGISVRAVKRRRRAEEAQRVSEVHTAGMPNAQPARPRKSQT